MSLAPNTASTGITESADLLGEYLRHVAALPCTQPAKYLRRIAVQSFLDRFDDLGAWMQRPTRARLLDLDRTRAWPFITWCILEGRLRADLDLLASRTGGHLMAWADRHRDEVATAMDIAHQLSWKRAWVDQVARGQLALVCMTMDVGLRDLDRATMDAFSELLAEVPSITANQRRVFQSRQRALVQVCFQLGTVEVADPHFNAKARTPWELAELIAQPRVRDVVIRYLITLSATLRPKTIADKCEGLRLFFDWLAREHQEVDRLAQLNRSMIEEFLIWNHGRPSRGRRRPGEPVTVSRQYASVAALRSFIGDLVFWEWPDAPSRQLVHHNDLPRIPMPVPRALEPLVDAALMEGVLRVEDPAARCGIQILRGTGMRIGELLELELDCLIDFGDHGTWLRVPIGKLNTERSVPLDEETLAAFDEWIGLRGRQRSIPHPRTGRPADFLFMIAGHAMGQGRIRNGLASAVEKAGLVDRSGAPLHVSPHQLRHTYGTTLINGGMSLQALMALLGHVTPEMTLRYAHLASDTVKDAYDEATRKMTPRRHVLVGGPTGNFVPARVDWLRSEMLKTRLAAGYCSRHPAAGPCPYANVCETCENFAPGPAFRGTLTDQLADIITLRNDAQERGWTAEAERHQRVAEAIERHLRELEIRGRSTSRT
ncbi:MAG: tyrosine-type recombinase/integrase [Ferrimicrobium sp.]